MNKGFRPNFGKSSKIIIFVSLLTTFNVSINYQSQINNVQIPDTHSSEYNVFANKKIYTNKQS